MTLQFSAFNRPSVANSLQSEQFDLLIIGGGITGAGIALDASSRGLKTALVEKNDFASGTSSRSTKLIHGGLRYLKQLEFGLVKEVGSERAIVHKLAPHLVVPEKMLLPLSEKRGLGYWLTSIGLMIYDWLAGVRPKDKRRMLTKQQTLRYEPLLRTDDINGGAIYAEYRTDDARLTIEIVKSSVAKGTVALNYINVVDFVYTNEQLSGVVVLDMLTHKNFTIKATAIVNAAGPWVDQLRDINHSKTGKHLHLTKGVHIVLPSEKLAVQQAIYFDVEDGRMIFAIPRGRTTYVGTTDTDYKGSIENVTTDKNDALYLINAVNARFPAVHLQLSDIESSWAGLRPLIYEEGKSASALSRKDEIFESASGLISIAGGKLTGYRKMAERVVNLVIKKHFASRQLKKCFTDKIKLTNSGFRNIKAVKVYQSYIAKQIQNLGLNDFFASYLVHNYGRQADEILALVRKQNEKDADISLALAELDFSIHKEMVVTPMDFFLRRTGMLYFHINRMEKLKLIILKAFKAYHGWTEEVVVANSDIIDSEIQKAKYFKL
jgi:glycerol-3-phosphate dehydrogenase